MSDADVIHLLIGLALAADRVDRKRAYRRLSQEDGERRTLYIREAAKVICEALTRGDPIDQFTAMVTFGCSAPRASQETWFKADKEDGGFFLRWTLRSYVTEHYSWCIPDRENVGQLAAFIGDDMCLSVGSGTGFLEHLLQEAVARVIATDASGDGPCTACEEKALRETWARHGVVWRRSRWTEVETLDAVAAVRKYGGHGQANVLLLSWPPGGSSIALSAFKGNRLIYIGEQGGCTADDAFDDLVSRGWRQMEDAGINIFSWPEVVDSVYYFVRLSPPLSAAVAA